MLLAVATKASVNSQKRLQEFYRGEKFLGIIDALDFTQILIVSHKGKYAKLLFNKCLECM